MSTDRREEESKMSSKKCLLVYSHFLTNTYIHTKQ